MQRKTQRPLQFELTTTDGPTPATWLLQQDQFFCHRGMDGYACIELLFRKSRLHGNGRQLQDLGRVRADHVGTDDLVGRLVDDQFVQGALVTVRKHVFHRAKVGRVHLDRAETIARL